MTLGADAAETSEAVTNRLWELGAVGVVEEDAAGAATLRAFFPPGTDAAARAAALREYLGELAALAVPGAQARVEVAPLPDEPWADAWRAHFRPVPVGRRLLVCPPWELPSRPEERTVIVIEPGRAFGTGGHGSTRSCLGLLERVLANGRVPRAVDVGCGSGILAIAAAALGVPRVEAIDLDPDAVAATEANARRNAVGDRVHAAVAAVESWNGAGGPARPGESPGRCARDARARAGPAGHARREPDRRRAPGPRGAGRRGGLRGGGLLARRSGRGRRLGGSPPAPRRVR